MKNVLINRRRLLIGDRFVLPGDVNRVLYTVTGLDLKVGPMIRRKGDSWYGYMDVESGVVMGTRHSNSVEILVRIPEAVLMREADVR
jgi:hypothetical protein